MSDLRVRATVSLPGLPLGEEVMVDDEEPYMADCLRTGLLVPVNPTFEAPPPRPAPDPPPEP